MLCNQGYYTSQVRGYSKNDLLFICTFNNNIQYNSLGELTTQYWYFKIQNWIIQIMTKSRIRNTCWQLLKRLEILPLQSQYILSVLLFVVKNKDFYTTNQEIHNITTRSNTNSHSPVRNLTVFQKGTYYSGIKLFNHLPLKIKSLSNKINIFKPALKRFLNLNSFYSVEEY